MNFYKRLNIKYPDIRWIEYTYADFAPVLEGCYSISQVETAVTNYVLEQSEYHMNKDLDQMREIMGKYASWWLCFRELWPIGMTFTFFLIESGLVPDFLSGYFTGCNYFTRVIISLLACEDLFMTLKPSIDLHAELSCALNIIENIHLNIDNINDPQLLQYILEAKEVLKDASKTFHYERRDCIEMSKLTRDIIKQLKVMLAVYSITT